MGDLLVRDVDDELKDLLKVRARRNGRSLQAEVRQILRDLVAGDRDGSWHGIAGQVLGNGFTADDVTRVEALRQAPDLFAGLGEDVRVYWQRRADESGRTLEAEVIASLASEAGMPARDEHGMGSDIVALFSGRGIGFTEDEVAEIERYRREPLSPPITFE